MHSSVHPARTTVRVTLAAAMALPPAFPYRDLIVLTAFSVVLGTLAIQGLTLKPLLRALDLHDEDPVGRTLLVQSAPYTVIGVMQKKMQMGTYGGPDKSAADPVTDASAPKPARPGVTRGCHP